MASERKPPTPCFCKPFHWYLTWVAGSLPSDALFGLANPYKEGTPTEIELPGTDLEYRIERIHMSADLDVGVTIKDEAGGNVLWGAHAIPAGFACIAFGEHSDKSRSGMACGANKAPVFTADAANGAVEVFGFQVPVH